MLRKKWRGANSTKTIDRLHSKIFHQKVWDNQAPSDVNTTFDGRVVVVAQLVERSLLTPEIRGSNPNIGKVLSTNGTFNNRKDENKEKEAHL